MKEDIIPTIVHLIDKVINNYQNEKYVLKVKTEVNQLMKDYPIFAAK